jgi:hypothetical protein
VLRLSARCCGSPLSWAEAAKDARLKKRTLTNLYNERPTWLKLAHEQLDRTVLWRRFR